MINESKETNFKMSHFTASCFGMSLVLQEFPSVGKISLGKKKKKNKQAQGRMIHNLKATSFHMDLFTHNSCLMQVILAVLWFFG